MANTARVVVVSVILQSLFVAVFRIRRIRFSGQKQSSLTIAHVLIFADSKQSGGVGQDHVH